MYYKLDKDKNALPCSLEEWEENFNAGYERIGFDQVDGKIVSTVFLSVSHNFHGTKKPFLFETIVFDEKGDEYYCVRYDNWQKAYTGHYAAVNIIQEENATNP